MNFIELRSIDRCVSFCPSEMEPEMIFVSRYRSLPGFNTDPRVSFASITSALMLAACGGGGGDDNASYVPTQSNRAPVITSATAISADEGSRLELVVTMSDPDGDQLRIVSAAGRLNGPDGEFFAVDPALALSTDLTSFVIGNLKPFDFENPEDEDLDNNYEVDIRITDGQATTTARADVTILDVAGDTFFQEQGLAAIIGVETFSDTGSSAAFIDDINGDRISEIVIGAQRTEGEITGEMTPGRPGAVYLLSGESVLSSESGVVELLHPDEIGSARIRWSATIEGRSEEYGHRVVALGDYDSDGVSELAVSGNGGGESPPTTDLHILSSTSLRAVPLNSTPMSLEVETMQLLRIVDDLDENKSNYGLGFDIALLPDLDGDFLDELLICASDARQTNNIPNATSFSGASFVVFGDAIARLLGQSPAVDIDALLSGRDAVRLEGTDRFDSDCSAVASVGDFDGDSIQDLLIGEARGGIASQSRAHLVFGKAISNARAAGESIRLEDLASSGRGFSIVSEAYLDSFGAAVAGVGDFDGDGLDDVVVGAPGRGSNAADDGDARGGALVLFGGASLSDVSLADAVTFGLGFTIDGGETLDETGSSLAPAGDLNSDGYDDFFMASPGADIERDAAVFPNNGRIDVIFGTNRISGIDSGFSTAARTVRILGAFSTYGIEDLDASRDIDGDGVRDLLIGASRSQRCPTSEFQSGVGHVVVVSGARILSALSKDGVVDLNDHLFGGKLTTNWPGSSTASPCL